MSAFDYTGRHAYHFVVVTRARAPVLIGELATQTVADLVRAADATHFELLAYVVMPNHVHVLALGVSDTSLSTGLMQRFKQLAGYRFKRITGRELWQWSFYDHTLRREEDLLALARYIVANPIRAGLASLEDEWPYAGGTLLGGAEAPSLRSRPSLSTPTAGEP